MSRGTQKPLLKMLGWTDYHSRRTDLPSDELASRIKHVNKKIKKFVEHQAATPQAAAVAA